MKCIFSLLSLSSMDRQAADYDSTDHVSLGDEKSNQQQAITESQLINRTSEDSETHHQSRPSMCGNINCPNCCYSSLASSMNLDCYNRMNDIFASNPGAHFHGHHFNRSRICSSNDSSQLDESYDYSRCTSPPHIPHVFQRQRARSLSCSPSKLHNESDIVVLQNEKFKEKFPNACQQMEEKLQQFIDSNLDLTQIDYCHTDPAARWLLTILSFYFYPLLKLNKFKRFIHNQIIELAKLCLEKSKASQLTNAYFDEMANSLDKLLKEAEEKCCQKELSIDQLSKFIKKFLLIVSRVARLLECLEFDPLEFCHLLDAAEAQVNKFVINFPANLYQNY